MNVLQRIEKERIVIPYMFQGYRRRVASFWFDSICADRIMHEKEFPKGILTYWHKRGYLSSSIKRWKLTNKKEADYISDFDYICLYPMNNSFSKWLYDMLTTQRVASPSGEHFRKVYFSIVQRENSQLILRVGHEDRRYTFEDILEFLEKKGTVELRPSYWNSEAEHYSLSVTIDEETGKKCFLCNGKAVELASLKSIFNELQTSYVIADAAPACYSFDGMSKYHTLKVWIANDIEESSQILAAEMNVSSKEFNNDEECENVFPVKLDNGTFKYNDNIVKIPGWDALKNDLCKTAAKISQISYFSVSVRLDEDADYIYMNFSCNPILPKGRFSKKLNRYLKNRLALQFQKRTPSEELEAILNKLALYEQVAVSRRGMRPYMYSLWRHAVWDDLFHTKNVTLPQKIWAHKHGFFSWRLYQYGLTKDNYTQFLSDYDYYWLNRINNSYQIWVNDKTTFRYIMEPFKEYIPKYYFSVFKRNDSTIIRKMWDCPEDISEGFDGLVSMLRREGKLAFKASAGTHGDGFYCLSYENGTIFANGQPYTTSELRQLVEGTKSFYVVTEYLEMHKDLKKIYDKSVNTVRMMVVNGHGYDPRILQTYMRIGSSKTGYTDNVGYGGICVFVDKETGQLYQPETIKDHVFYDCPVHPDTGTPIAGYLPHWDLVRSKVLEICRYLCELEYLGFDIAITDEGFQILEINIHQDLHKVATFDEDIMEFFKRKIECKYESLKKTDN